MPVPVLTKALRVPRTHPVIRHAYELHHINLRWNDDPLPVVYAILDTRDIDVYFGETLNAYQRRQWHDARLRGQKHRNLFLCDACPNGIDGRRWRFLVLEEIYDGKRQLRQREDWWIAQVPTCINARYDQFAREFRALFGR